MEISKIIPHRVLRNKCGEHTYFEGNSVFLLLPEPQILLQNPHVSRPKMKYLYVSPEKCSFQFALRGLNYMSENKASTERSLIPPSLPRK